MTTAEDNEFGTYAVVAMLDATGEINVIAGLNWSGIVSAMTSANGALSNTTRMFIFPYTRSIKIMTELHIGQTQRVGVEQAAKLHFQYCQVRTAEQICKIQQEGGRWNKHGELVFLENEENDEILGVRHPATPQNPIFVGNLVSMDGSLGVLHEIDRGKVGNGDPRCFNIYLLTERSLVPAAYEDFTLHEG